MESAAFTPTLPLLLVAEDAGEHVLEDVEDATLTDDARRERWQARRPPVDHLEPGLLLPDGGAPLPVFDVGDRIVVDRRTALLRGSPWLETIVGKVRSIDDDVGLVSLWDEAGDARNPPVRWASMVDGMHDFRLAPASGDPFDPDRIARARAAAARAAALAAGPPRRGRGRPRGSKNRPKDVIQAERAARRAAREEARQ